jgi:hypothetical protein
LRWLWWRRRWRAAFKALEEPCGLLLVSWRWGFFYNPWLWWGAKAHCVLGGMPFLCSWWSWRSGMDHTMLPAVLVCETACICGVSATVLQTCVWECYGRVGCPCSPGKRSLIGTNWLSACIGGVCGLRWTVCSPFFRAAKRNAFAVGLVYMVVCGVHTCGRCVRLSVNLRGAQAHPLVHMSGLSFPEPAGLCLSIGELEA